MNRLTGYVCLGIVCLGVGFLVGKSETDIPRSYGAIEYRLVFFHPQPTAPEEACKRYRVVHVGEATRESANFHTGWDKPMVSIHTSDGVINLYLEPITSPIP